MLIVPWLKMDPIMVIEMNAKNRTRNFRHFSVGFGFGFGATVLKSESKYGGVFWFERFRRSFELAAG
jgi:hypothetical protein